MSLQGSLSELSLPDVIQLVSVSGKTGAFEIRRMKQDGQNLSSATARSSMPWSAISAATAQSTRWRSGPTGHLHRSTPARRSDQVTIHLSNATLMMEAARRLDEWRVLSRKIPSLDLVPYFTSRDQGADQVTLSPHEWILVTRIDGEHTIEEIANELKWAPFDVSKLLFGMITTGLVALGNPGDAGDGGQTVADRAQPGDACSAWQRKFVR